MILTDSKIRAMKSGEKVRYVADGDGLILAIRPSGVKSWIVRGWNGGKERRKTVGVFPEVGLKDARLKAAEIRARWENGEEKDVSFKSVAERWYEWISAENSASYGRSIRIRLDKYILPRFKGMALREIKPSMIIELCRQCEAVGMTDTAQRIRQFMKQIFDFAIAGDVVMMNPAASIGLQLRTHSQTSYPAITDDDGIGELMRRIKGHSRAVVRCALMLSAWTALRPGNVRMLLWKEVDLDNAMIVIDAARMKAGRAHSVPLPVQAVEMLRLLKPVTGESEFVFPGPCSNDRPLSENAARSALRSMGYDSTQMTWHGFRAMFSTVANRYEWNPDVVEEQLAHKSADKTRSAYNRANYMPQRKVLVQWWANYLDALLDGKPTPKKPKG